MKKKSRINRKIIILICSVFLTLLIISVILFSVKNDKTFGGIKVIPNVNWKNGTDGSIHFFVYIVNNSETYLLAPTLKVSNKYGECDINLIGAYHGPVTYKVYDQINYVYEKIPLFTDYPQVSSMNVYFSGDHCGGKVYDKYYFNVSGTFIINNETVRDEIILKGKYPKSQPLF